MNYQNPFPPSDLVIAVQKLAERMSRQARATDEQRIQAALAYAVRDENGKIIMLVMKDGSVFGMQ